MQQLTDMLRESLHAGAYRLQKPAGRWVWLFGTSVHTHTLENLFERRKVSMNELTLSLTNKYLMDDIRYKISRIPVENNMKLKATEKPLKVDHAPVMSVKHKKKVWRNVSKKAGVTQHRTSSEKCRGRGKISNFNTTGVIFIDFNCCRLTSMQEGAIFVQCKEKKHTTPARQTSFD